MSNKQTPDAKNASKQETLELTYRELTYRPPRNSVRIEDGDWYRWIRMISSIPKREGTYRDFGLIGIGIAIPILVDWLFTPPRDIGSGLLVGIVFLVSGLWCLSFDRKLGKISTQRVEGVLQDMNEVRERAIQTEETIKVEGNFVGNQNQRGI